ncbi:MAG: glutathione S-transferase family protein [Pseudomonadota bacterium]
MNEATRIRLFWSAQSRASRAVWMLNECDVDYARVPVDLKVEPHSDDPDFLRASPMGKVPALVDGDVVIAESAAICTYLADRYAGGRLAPALDAAERGPYLYWMFYAPAVIEPAMSEKFNNVTPNRGSNGWGDFDTMIATLEAGLADSPWILGNDFSAADVMLGSSTVFMRMFKVLPDSAVLNAYADRCLARDGYRAALALEQ